MISIRTLASATVLALLLGMSGAQANDYQAKLEQLVHDKLQAVAADPLVIKEIKAANEAHAAYDAAKIDQLDKEWRSEVSAGGGALVNGVLGNTLSKHLVEVRDGSNGLYAEIIVMDNKGLNAGISNTTSDYMQGDEAKWQKTFQAGADKTLIDEVEQDESSGTFISQVSLTVTDPESHAPIGAITFGIDVEKLP
jgi:hypothetical protein